jgi:hypothetical protein
VRGIVVRSYITSAAFIGALALQPSCSNGGADTSELGEAELVELLAIANADAPFEFEFEGERFRLELEMQRAPLVDAIGLPRAAGEVQPIKVRASGDDVGAFMPLTASVRLLRIESAESSELLVQSTTDGGMSIPGRSLGPSSIAFDSSGRADGFVIELRSPDAQHFHLSFAHFHVGPGAVFFSARRPEP